MSKMLRSVLSLTWHTKPHAKRRTSTKRAHGRGAYGMFADAGDHLWARSLFRLHVSLLYFFAAIFKVQSEWLASGGGSLYKD